jgi:type IV secretion system protein VirB1
MIELLMMCAPAIDPVTMAAVVVQESGGRPWVIHNNTTGKSLTFDTKADVVAAAMSAVDRDESVDMGLVQINNKNLPALGLSVAQVFDPCINIAVGAKILAAGYKKTGSLGNALSIYNTGRSDSKVGLAYAQKVFQQANVTVPRIPGGQLAKLPKLSSSATNPAALPPVRLAVTLSPLAGGLSPLKATLQPAKWR